jgi:hypothetical protein
LRGTFDAAKDITGPAAISAVKLRLNTNRRSAGADGLDCILQGLLALPDTSLSGNDREEQDLFGSEAVLFGG